MVLVEFQKLVKSNILKLFDNFKNSPAVLKTIQRMTQDYVPAKKQKQDLLTPDENKISFDNPIVGFGFYGTNADVESYFIFSDGSKSEIQTTTAL